ncbi:MAG: lysophospholipase [Fervidobacterium sp.]
MIYSFKKCSTDGSKDKKNAKDARDTVVIVHGLGEHIGRYERLINMLIEEGFCVIGFDLPGHGKSSGKRGHTSIEEVLSVIDSVTKDVDNFILFGHSLGGLIAVRYTETRPTRVKKLIVSSPALHLEPKKSQLFLLKLFSVLMPRLTLSNGIDPNLLSRNKEAVQMYISDPLVHDRISINLGKSMIKNVELAYQQSGRIVCPTAILVGTDDKVTPPIGAKTFYQELKCNKFMKEFDGGYHELFDDLEHSDEFHKTILTLIKEEFCCFKN